MTLVRCPELWKSFQVLDSNGGVDQEATMRREWEQDIRLRVLPDWMRSRLLVALGKRRLADQRLLGKAFLHAGCREPCQWAETWGRCTQNGEQFFVAENTGCCPPDALDFRSIRDVVKFCDFFGEPLHCVIKSARGLWVDGTARRPGMVPGTIWSYEARGMHIVIAEGDSLGLLSSPDVPEPAESFGSVGS